MSRTLIVGLVACLVHCGGTPSDRDVADRGSGPSEAGTVASESRPDVGLGAEPETPRRTAKPQRENGAQNSTAGQEPSIALSVEDPAATTIVAKTEAVERQAANPMAGRREASQIDSIESLVALRDAAAGRVLEVPEGTLAHFYAALAPLAAATPPSSTHVVRVLHVGDSFIGQDVFPHAVRRRMQRRFGDAGPGFQLVDIHHRANIHRGISLKSAHFRTCFVRDKCLGGEHGRYGYGGHVSRGGPGASSVIAPREVEAFAAGKGHVEIWYQRHPRGGTLQIQVGELEERLPTKSDVVEDAWTRVPLGSSTQQLRLKAIGAGRVHAYGVVFENGESGIVWDSTPHTGAFARRVLAQEPAHFAGQVGHRDVDLLVYNFGGNDVRRVAKGTLSRAKLQSELEQAIELYRSGQSEMSCIVIGSTDHAKSAGTEVSPDHMRALVGAQRGAALAQGCAFFDSISVFGGPGQAKSLARGKHALVGADLSHLTALGRELLADVFVEELVSNMPQE